MSPGGFNGSDPFALDELKALVAAGKVHYFISGDMGQAEAPAAARRAPSAIGSCRVSLRRRWAASPSTT
jgi:hypothetical protein